MERKLNCEEVLAALPLFVGGDLESPDPAAVERHLATCGGCTAALERSRAARAAFAGLSAAAGPPPEIWSGVRARLVAEGLLRGAPAPEPVAVPAARRWLPLAGSLAAALLIALGLWLGRGPRPDGPVPGGDEPRVADEQAPVESPSAPAGPESLARPEGGARPVALQRLAPEDWPLPVPTGFPANLGPTGGDGVMAGGVPNRFH